MGARQRLGATHHRVSLDWEDAATGRHTQGSPTSPGKSGDCQPASWIWLAQLHDYRSVTSEPILPLDDHSHKFLPFTSYQFQSCSATIRH